METAQVTKTAKNAEELFKLIMNMYWTYLNALETFAERIPETETAVLSELVDHMKEVQAALEHDISIFQKAISSDIEDLHKVSDQLKINTIYQKLKK